jgi:hypothetical protein
MRREKNNKGNKTDNRLVLQHEIFLVQLCPRFELILKLKKKKEKKQTFDNFGINMKCFYRKIHTSCEHGAVLKLILCYTT